MSKTKASPKKSMQNKLRVCRHEKVKHLKFVILQGFNYNFKKNPQCRLATLAVF